MSGFDINDDDDDKTPVDGVWRMHPDVSVSANPPEPKKLDPIEDMLATVKELLEESRDIKISARRSCDLAIKAFEDIPLLKSRMKRAEIIAISTTLINLLMITFLLFR